METARYLFQSPYTSPVQVGRPDPSVKKEQASETKPQQSTAELVQSTNQTLSNAQTFMASQKQEVQATVKTNNGNGVQSSEKANKGQEVSSANRSESASKSSASEKSSGVASSAKSSTHGLENAGKPAMAHQNQSSRAQAHIDTYA